MGELSPRPYSSAKATSFGQGQRHFTRLGRLIQPIDKVCHHIFQTCDIWNGVLTPVTNCSMKDREVCIKVQQNRLPKNFEKVAFDLVNA